MGEKVTLDKIADKSVFEQKYRYKNKIGDRADSKIRQRKYVVESLCRDFSDKKSYSACFANYELLRKPKMQSAILSDVPT